MAKGIYNRGTKEKYKTIADSVLSITKKYNELDELCKDLNTSIKILYAVRMTYPEVEMHVKDIVMSLDHEAMLAKMRLMAKNRLKSNIPVRRYHSPDYSRNYNCYKYDVCLDEAAHMNTRIRCDSCTVYKPDTLFFMRHF